MLKDTGIISNAAIQYVVDKSLRETEEQRALRIATQSHFEEDWVMMGAPEGTQFLAMLIKIIGAKRMIEVGVFTGYTTLTFAQAATGNGKHKEGVKIVALDTSDKYTALGQEHWKRANLDDVIDLRIAPAVDSLKTMTENEEELESYDLVFIDADKDNYVNYYEAALKLVRQGGLIVIDNVLWSGKVYDESVKDEDSPSTKAIRQLNDHVKDDKRVDVSMLTVADGITICRKL